MGEFWWCNLGDDSGVVRGEEERRRGKAQRVGGPMATSRRGGGRAGRPGVPGPWRGVAEAGGRGKTETGEGEQETREDRGRIGSQRSVSEETEGGERGGSGTLGSLGRRTLGRYPFLFLAKSSKPKGKTLFEYFAEKTYVDGKHEL